MIENLELQIKIVERLAADGFKVGELYPNEMLAIDQLIDENWITIEREEPAHYRLTSRGVILSEFLANDRLKRAMLKEAKKSRGVATLADLLAFGRLKNLSRPLAKAIGVKSPRWGPVRIGVLVGVIGAVIAAGLVTLLGNQTQSTFSSLGASSQENQRPQSFSSFPAVADGIGEGEEEADANQNVKNLTEALLRSSSFKQLSEELQTRIASDQKRACESDVELPLCKELAQLPENENDGFRKLAAAYQNYSSSRDAPVIKTSLLSLASARGDAVAMAELGSIYANGVNGLQDYATARLWSLKAAEAGDSRGAYNVGVLTYSGLGGEQSKWKAVAWLSLSGHLGFERAQALANTIRSELNQSQLDKANKMASELIGQAN